MTEQTRLHALADRCGVATDYWDWQGRHVTVSDETIQAVLAAMGIDAHDDDSAQSALETLDLAPWRRTLPPIVVYRQGERRTVAVHVRDGDPVTLQVREERGGGTRDCPQVDRWVPPRHVDGRLIGEATFEMPEGLPLGWHTLRATTPEGVFDCSVVVTPRRMQVDDGPWEQKRWGFMAQLYSVRSRRSWGMGDFADLRELAGWSARDLGADFLLVNPLHAGEPVPPLQPSPYLPTTRRFVNPLYIRVEDVRETAYLDADEQALLRELAAPLTDPAGHGELIDRDASWAAKSRALEQVYRVQRSVARESAFAKFCRREGEGLVGFATWCAFYEHFDGPTGSWPQEYRRPGSEQVTLLAERLADRIRFYQWLQWIADEQLAAAQAEAKDAGMAYGIVHDLAVGVHPEGADAWALGPALASGVSVGAPPDAFSQRGQNWSQPPWRPDTLAESGYEPYRDLLRTVLRHCGALRVDHVMALFRLWWVPAGMTADQGTYVRYDHDALLGIMCLEAHRAGAFLVGEDLGVVEPWVRDVLADRGVLGTSVLWFERQHDGTLLPAEHWRRLCLATVNTHDLPPSAGYLAGDHVELRNRLGLLTRSVEEERAVDAADRDKVLQALRQRHLLPDGDPGERRTIEALHRFITWAPSRLLGVALTDAVGERRSQNQPGTDREYPNWRIPLADGDGNPVLLEDLRTSPRVKALAEVVGGRSDR